MMMDQLFERVTALRNPSVLGLDTKIEYLPEDLQKEFDPEAPFESAAEMIFEFNRKIIDAVCDIVGCIKLQSAYYEMYGPAGLKTFERTARYAKNKGMLVIADAKRNDIGSTAEAYATAFLGETFFPDGVYRDAYGADMLTINGYLGVDGIQPFLYACKKYEKGIFVLVKNSNPSSGQLQDLKLEEGMTVYQKMGSLVAQWGEDQVGKYGYSAVGAVVGATYPEQGEILRKQLKHTPFLLPGYGAQGATGADLAKSFDKNGLGSVVNASRSLMCAYREEGYRGLEFYDAAREAAIAMKEDILKALEQAGRLNY